MQLRVWAPGYVDVVCLDRGKDSIVWWLCWCGVPRQRGKDSIVWWLCWCGVPRQRSKDSTGMSCLVTLHTLHTHCGVLCRFTDISWWLWSEELRLIWGRYNECFDVGIQETLLLNVVFCCGSKCVVQNDGWAEWSWNLVATKWEFVELIATVHREQLKPATALTL
jgi:hypothetical protein